MQSWFPWQKTIKLVSDLTNRLHDSQSVQTWGEIRYNENPELVQGFVLEHVNQ